MRISKGTILFFCNYWKIKNITLFLNISGSAVSKVERPTRQKKSLTEAPEQ